jgi:DNA-binding response OmpR family regulator
MIAAGFEVFEARTGQHALEYAAQVDVVVLDVHLPDIDGFEVCRRLRAAPGGVSLPIIHVSAVFVVDANVRAGTDAGADAYLIEPVPPAVLVQVIRSTLAARRAR